MDNLIVYHTTVCMSIKFFYFYVHKHTQVYNPVKILSQMDEAVSTATEKEASLPPSSSTPEDPHSQNATIGTDVCTYI